jgi:hypothetical protein
MHLFLFLKVAVTFSNLQLKVRHIYSKNMDNLLFRILCKLMHYYVFTLINSEVSLKTSNALTFIKGPLRMLH